MTEEFLDTSCPICGKKDKTGWWDSLDDCVIMACTRCRKMYKVINNRDKQIIERDD